MYPFMKKIAFSFFVFCCFSFGVLSAQPTFSKDIAPIIYNNCGICHRPGEIGPMPLTNYQQVKNWASMIEYVTSIKYMPPWPPEKSYSTLLEERGLEDAEIQLIADWVAGGMQQGDPSLEPSFPNFPAGSQVGEPDLVLSFAESYVHGGDNTDQYQIFVLPTGLTEDKIVKSVELRPGNRKIVHHAIIGLDVTGEARSKDAQTVEYGFPSFGTFGVEPAELYAGYVPGTKARKYPERIGQPIYAGSDLVIQMHYAPIPVEEKDSSSVNLFFADAEETIDRFVKYEVMLPLPNTLLNGPFFLLPGDVKTFHGVWTVPDKISVLGITPHMHLLGQDWEVYAVSPSGDTTNLIKIPEWNFNWQGTYFFDRFKVLEPGTEVHALATYDNSENNPMNPNSPPAFVTWGEGTKAEMYFLPISYVDYQPGDEDIVFKEDVLADAEDLGLQFPANEIKIIFPNPTNGVLNIGFSLSKNTALHMEVLDLNGKVIRTLKQSNNYPVGNHLEKVNVGSLASGVYLLRLRGEGFSVTEKFSLVRE